MADLTTRQKVRIGVCAFGAIFCLVQSLRAAPIESWQVWGFLSALYGYAGARHG